MAKISPALLQARMSAPASFRGALLDFLRANKAKVDVSKSIGELHLYDQLAVGGVTVARFFQGAATPARTNVGNSFTRPEAEHTIITGIRLYDGINANIEATDWSTGLSAADTKNATFSVQSNGVTYLRNFPAVAANDEMTDNERGIIYLTEPILWQGQTSIEVNFDFPVAPAANTNLRVALVGVGTLS